jgi:hypothetical protein
LLTIQVELGGASLPAARRYRATAYNTEALSVQPLTSATRAAVIMSR